MGALACAIIALGLYWQPIIAFADRSLNFFVGPFFLGFFSPPFLSRNSSDLKDYNLRCLRDGGQGRPTLPGFLARQPDKGAVD